MAIPTQILPDDILRSVFRARLVLYLFGVAIALVVVVAGSAPILLPMLASGALVAWWQLRSNALRTAWVMDSLIAVAVASVEETPIGVAIVIGWGAVIGLVDEKRSWVYPAGIGLAAACAAMLAPAAEVAWSIESVLRVVTVAVIGVFFVLMFRRVGDLLRGNERELRAFFERVPVALTRTSPDGKLLEFNQAVAELFDNPSIGEQVIDRYADPAQRQAFVDALLADGVVHNFEVSFDVGSDRRVESLISANAVHSAGGELRYIETAITDITRLRQMESERELLARVINSTSDLVALGNFDGSIRYANPAARAWTKRYVTDDDYTHSAQLLSAEDYEILQNALQSTGEWSGTLNIEARGGPRIVMSSFQVLATGDGYTIASIARDITDEAETQRQLKDLLKAKDELVASISHEIRTPLSVVLGLASELRDRHDDFDIATRDELATLIAEQGQEIAHIVEDLLVAARADTGSIILDLVAVDLREETETTLRSIAESERPDGLINNVAGTCMGDPGRVRQILRNLIINASRYGGDQVRLGSYAAGGRVSVEVVDNGTGVPAESVEAIFEPFARAHSVDRSRPQSASV